MGLVCGCQLLTGPLDVEAMRRSVENLSYQSVVVLCSEVPGSRAGAQVDTISYSADEEAALFQMFAVAEEAANRWDANVALALRLGELIPGDVSSIVTVACSGPERALDCCRFITEAVAERAPIWSS